MENTIAAAKDYGARILLPGTIYNYVLDCLPDFERRLAAARSKPAPGRREAIEAQIRDEIAVVQGVMICDLRQDEHLVRFGAPEVRRVIEVCIAEPGVHTIAVVERTFEVGHDLGLRTLHGSRGGERFTLGV